jgi:hypothetical protein
MLSTFPHSSIHSGGGGWGLVLGVSTEVMVKQHLSFLVFYDQYLGSGEKAFPMVMAVDSGDAWSFSNTIELQ